MQFNLAKDDDAAGVDFALQPKARKIASRKEKREQQREGREKGNELARWIFATPPRTGEGKDQGMGGNGGKGGGAAGPTTPYAGAKGRGKGGVGKGGFGAASTPPWRSGGANFSGANGGGGSGWNWTCRACGTEDNWPTRGQCRAPDCQGIAPAGVLARLGSEAAQGPPAAKPPSGGGQAPGKKGEAGTDGLLGLLAAMAKAGSSESIAAASLHSLLEEKRKAAPQIAPRHEEQDLGREYATHKVRLNNAKQKAASARKKLEQAESKRKTVLEEHARQIEDLDKAKTFLESQIEEAEEQEAEEREALDKAESFRDIIRAHSLPVQVCDDESEECRELHRERERILQTSKEAAERARSTAAQIGEIDAKLAKARADRAEDAKKGQEQAEEGAKKAKAAEEAASAAAAATAAAGVAAVAAADEAKKEEQEARSRADSEAMEATESLVEMLDDKIKGLQKELHAAQEAEEESAKVEAITKATKEFEDRLTKASDRLSRRRRSRSIKRRDA